MKKILITGITGFVGHHLANHFVSQKAYEIIGTYRTDNSLVQLDQIKDHIKFQKIDLLDADAVSELIATQMPDFIFHLAAQASPAVSFKNPKETLINNTISQLNILEGIKNANLINSRLMAITTGEIYGKVTPSDLPIDEDTPLRPISPYAISKLTQDFLAQQYFLTSHFDIIRIRPFNHVGPFQKTGFVIADFAKQIAEIEKYNHEAVISVGNLEAKRDFTDVRDMVKAYDLLMQKGISGEVYNIGSGSSRKISDILSTMLSFSKLKIDIHVDPEKFRPVDVPEIICDNQKFQKLTGWQPEVPFEKTLQDILDYWRKIV